MKVQAVKNNASRNATEHDSLMVQKKKNFFQASSDSMNPFQAASDNTLNPNNNPFQTSLDSANPFQVDLPKMNIQPKLANAQETTVQTKSRLENQEENPSQPSIQAKCASCQAEDKKAVQKKSDGSSNTPANTSVPKSSIGKINTSFNSLSNGQYAITHSLPFTQVIQREPSAEADGEAQNREEETLFVELEPLETLSSNDAIRAMVVHSATVSSGGTVDPGNFGTTNANFKLKATVISTAGGYLVIGTMIHKITWGVLSGTGPSGQVQINSDTDSDIKACNYQLIAKDLTPDASGRPPRTKYWAQDLTRRHELFHAVNQRQLSYGPLVAIAMQNWLGSQTASSASQIQSTLIPQAQVQGLNVYNALATTQEFGAYADGLPFYQARANSIKTKGDAGDYGHVSVRVTVHPKGGGRHTVVRGDTLWGIARQTYGHGRYWRNIHRANPGKARRGGNLIFPGQVFDLPNINIDQDLSVALQFGSKMIITGDVTVPGGGSHTFLELPKDIFEDTSNCSGNMTVDVLDPNAPIGTGGSLLSTTWSIPTTTNRRNGHIEVNLELI